MLGWNPGINPVGFDPAKAGKYAMVVINHLPGAVYTGLAIATDHRGTTRLYAANFGAGKVDVFDTSFQQVFASGAFLDPYLPRGYAPFNIVPVTAGGVTRMFVTYALQDLTQLAGQGHGIVNTFNLDGGAYERFAQHGQLNAPWAVAPDAPRFRRSRRHSLDRQFRRRRDQCLRPGDRPFCKQGADAGTARAVVIDGLWSLKFGNGGNGGSVNTLYFTAGPNGEHDGIFGSLDPK